MSNEDKIRMLLEWLKERGTTWENLKVSWCFGHEEIVARAKILEQFLSGHLIMVEHCTNLGALGVGTMWFLRVLPKP